MMSSATEHESLEGRVGLWSRVLDFNTADEARALVARYEEQGWTSFWTGEVFGREAFTTALLTLGATSRMTVGVGVANIYARDPVAMNAAVRSVAGQFPGRFVAGLGVSHQVVVEKFRNGAYGSPLSKMRAYLREMKDAPYQTPGDERPPVILAALGPKMLALARDEADGAIPYLVLPSHTAQARAILGPDKLMYVEQPVSLATSDEEFRVHAFAHLKGYTELPNYRRSLLRQGFTSSDLERGGSEQLHKAMVVRGEAAVRKRVSEHLAAGADQVLLQILGAGPADLPIADARRLAQALL